MTATIEELRNRIERLQSGRPQVAPVPTHPSLAPALQLQVGGVYAAGCTSAAMLLMAGPSSHGAWSAVVGMPGFGLEAAAAAGVELARTVLVPAPGEHWLAVVSALVDAVGVVVLAPPAQVSERDAAIVRARLHRRQGVLVSVGGASWPRPDAVVDLRDANWSGIEAGRGYLRARQATLEVVERGRARPRLAEVG